MIQTQLTREDASQEKARLIKMLTKTESMVRDILPETDNLPPQISFRKLAKEKISMLRHNLEVLVDRCQILIDNCQQAEKGRYTPETQSSMFDNRDLECLIVEAMAVYMHSENQGERTLSLWVSPSTLTQLVRKSNPNKPFAEPHYNANEWLYEYELFYKGDKLYAFKDLFWPKSSARQSTNTHDGSTARSTAIPAYCYEELLSLRNSARINWYEELSRLFPLREPKAVPRKGTALKNRDIIKHTENSNDSDELAILKDLHLHKIDNCHYLLTCDGFSIQMSESCLQDILNQITDHTNRTPLNRLTLSNNLIKIKSDMEVTLLINQEQRQSLRQEAVRLLENQT